MHGTYRSVWPAILQRGGLLRMSRTHVHLAEGVPEEVEDGAVISGMRGSCELVVHVDVRRAALDGGLRFYRSTNGVILTPGLGDDGLLPLRYVARVTDRRTGAVVYANPNPPAPARPGGSEGGGACRPLPGIPPSLPSDRPQSGGSGPLIRVVHGDLLSANGVQFIVHQTNCVSKGAQGLARSIFQRFPYADVYARRAATGRKDTPGTIDVRGGDRGGDRGGGDGHRQGIIGVFGQHGPGKPKGGADGAFDSRAARLGWFAQGLAAIARIPHLRSVAFPFQIGCGLAGGDWPSFRAALEAFAADVAPRSVTVTLYKLPNATFDRKAKVYTSGAADAAAGSVATL